MDIKDIRIFPVSNAGKLVGKANATLCFPGGHEITLKGLRIHKGEKGSHWVGLPKESYLKDNKTKYADIVWANELTTGQLFKAILSEFRNQFK